MRNTEPAGRPGAGCPARDDRPVTDLAAVLFDMDGTLVDSEKAWSIGLDELAATYDATLSTAARIRMIGTSMSESMQILHDDIGRPDLDIATSVDRLEQRVKVLYRAGLIWRPGAQELLAKVRAAGVATALVTATQRHMVDVALLTLGADQFDAVVCGDEVDETKPHPMPYLTAARLIGVDIGQCVAIEDSPNGLASARAAGCAVLAVPCEVPLSDLDGVTLVPSLTEVDVEFLRKLVG